MAAIAPDLRKGSPTPSAELLQEVTEISEFSLGSGTELQHTFIVTLRDLGEQSMIGYVEAIRIRREQLATRIATTTNDIVDRLIYDAIKTGASAKRWIDFGKTRINYIDPTTRVSEISVHRPEL